MRLVLLGVALLGMGADICAAADCPGGASVDDVKRCPFIKFYRSDEVSIDKRIADRVGASNSSDARSYALIIGNSSYPNLIGAQSKLAAAGVDVANLVEFLTGPQRFDEVIVLENEAASRDNIDYFLNTYLPQQALDHGNTSKGRLLVAYSGHGVTSATSPPSLLLSHARSADDPAALYSMQNFRGALENLAGRYFHVLALINACYGGSLFGWVHSGGNPSVSELSGSYALTAGPDNTVVASFGGPADGSIFFDALIKGITRGDADPDFARLVAVDGSILQQGGITRLGALATYLDTEYEIINRRKIPIAGGGVLVVKKPFIGAVQSGNELGRGGFFFLSPIKLSPGLVAALDVPAGPASSLPGRPDIKVFSAQETYPIKGIDVTEHEGAIDWKVVRRSTDLRFAYARALSWAGPDRAFPGHWTSMKSVGLDRGAIVVFDFCLPVEEQLKTLKSIVRDPGELPMTIEVRNPPPGFNKRQYGCFQKRGRANAQAAILSFAQLVETSFGKTPILLGNRSDLQTLLDERSDRYMLWLASYKTSKSASADIKLPGTNPWTIWQYSAFTTVAGIGRNVDGNAFFGSEMQYKAFKMARSNVAITKSGSPQQ